MQREEEWSQFLSALHTCAYQERTATKEYAYRKQRQEHLDEMLATNLTQEQRVMVEEVLFELGVAQEHEAHTFYRQGMKDCVWLLKTLGVLA